MKKYLVVLILISFFFIPCVNAEDLVPNAKSAILIEESTGKILYEKNSDEKRAPASMTKVMSMLLIMEALDNKQISLNDEVTISQNAADMGGSQLFLQPNQTAKVEDLLKGIAVASGNDAVVAMAEKIAGSEEKFVDMMNKKAKELGLSNTHFENACGLDSDNHYSSANDMSIIAKELVKHKKILEFSGTYEDYLRKNTEKSFWLVNTNKLVRYYQGVDGLKTGYTKNAGYCITTTAERGNMRLITVVMGEPSSAIRNSETTTMLDYGFNTYEAKKIITKDSVISKQKVEFGKKDSVELTPMEDYKVLKEKSSTNKNITYQLSSNPIKAPVKVGDKVGKIKIIENNKTIQEIDVTVKENVNKMNIFKAYYKELIGVIKGI